MGRNKNKIQRGGQQRHPQPNPGAERREFKNIEEKATVMSEATQGIEEQPLAEPLAQSEVDAPHSPTFAQVKELWSKVERLEKVYSALKEKNEAREKQLFDQEQVLARSKEEAAARERSLDSQQAQLKAEEDELEKKRLAARAGFLEERRASTKEIVDRIDAMISSAETWGVEAKIQAAQDAIRQREQLAIERSQLDQKIETIRTREAEVHTAEEKIRTDAEFLRQKESMFDGRMERLKRELLTRHQLEIEDLQDQLVAEQGRVIAKERQARELQLRLDTYGQDPDGQVRLIAQLKEKLRGLEELLSRRPEESEVAELRQTASRVSQVEREATHWHSKFDECASELRRLLIPDGERKVLKEQIEALEAQRETLLQAIALHKRDWEELQTQENAARPFPSCSAYDELEMQSRGQYQGREVDSLAELAHEIRDHMAKNTESPFYYSESDVRIFLAGLAASRLHLLQGISGTGKTSLPREFFKALGERSAVEIIEVQAGWRDKDDLFGFYNAFQKQFAESEFTKALYRALLPENEDRPMVIVLDEMNLAHPEQYFSVMLSLLENSMHEDVGIPLLTSEVQNLPRLFEGVKLPLPKNVWFVGTANHDETTVAFADKTYDRAHVQTLPSHFTPFEPTHRGSLEPISFESLTDAFANAADKYSKEANQAKVFLRSSLRGEFEEYGVGWGNRLERQIDRFVPVILASGGTMTEAVDHLVATKLVRKLENQFGIRPDQLELLADHIEYAWQHLKSSGTPQATSAALRDEARRLLGNIGA
jgi:hypothetical protein